MNKLSVHATDDEDGANALEAAKQFLERMKLLIGTQRKTSKERSNQLALHKSFKNSEITAMSSVMTEYMQHEKI